MIRFLKTRAASSDPSSQCLEFDSLESLKGHVSADRQEAVAEWLKTAQPGDALFLGDNKWIIVGSERPAMKLEPKKLYSVVEVKKEEDEPEYEDDEPEYEDEDI